jgi:hypothetical protein
MVTAGFGARHDGPRRDEPPGVELVAEPVDAAASRCDREGRTEEGSPGEDRRRAGASGDRAGLHRAVARPVHVRAVDRERGRVHGGRDRDRTGKNVARPVAARSAGPGGGGARSEKRGDCKRRERSKGAPCSHHGLRRVARREPRASMGLRT